MLRLSLLTPLAALVAAAAPLPALVGQAASPVGVLSTVPPTLPTLTSTAPVATAVPFSLDYAGASDAHGGLLRVELWYRTASGSWAPAGLTDTTADGSFLFQPPSGSDPGLFHFAAVAVDQIGNHTPLPSGASGTGQLTIDLQPAASVGDWWVIQ